MSAINNSILDPQLMEEFKNSISIDDKVKKLLISKLNAIKGDFENNDREKTYSSVLVLLEALLKRIDSQLTEIESLKNSLPAKD